MNEKKQSRLRRAKSTRLHIRALGATRLCVNRTPRHIYARYLSRWWQSISASFYSRRYFTCGYYW